MTEIPEDIVRTATLIVGPFLGFDMAIGPLFKAISEALHAERLATSKRVEEETVERFVALTDKFNHPSLDRAARALPRKY
jgi:hypothetical protein